jgi:two-component system response regulator NreC
MARYKIILADDHTMFREGLKGLIDKEPSLKVVGEAKDGEELLQKLNVLPCDLVVLDLCMPQMDGMTALKNIRHQFPQVSILILTMQKDYEHFKHAMANGASGYILKEDAHDQLIAAIRAVSKGKPFVSPTVSTVLTDRFIRSLDDGETPSLEILTAREKQILGCIADGYSNKMAAAKLKISVRTVEAHRVHLTDKLGIKSTAGLVRYAISKGII